jgi:hypothetical protein
VADGIDVIADTLVVRPGDVLVVRVRPDISRAHFDEFADRLRTGLAEKLIDPPEFLVVAAEQLAVIQGVRRG